MRGALLVAALLLLPLSLPVAAADGKAAAPAATAFNTQRKVARDTAGSIYVAYVRSEGGSPRVLVARSGDGGITWSDLLPSTDPSRPSDRATLAVDAAGTLHLAWTETVGEERQVLYAAFAGGAWSHPLRLSGGEGYAGYPSIAVDSHDRVHVAWYGFDGQAYQVHYRFLEGGRWSDPRTLTSGHLDALNPALAVDGADGLHVAYYRSDGRRLGVYYLASRPAWGSPLLLSDPSADALDPTIAVDAAGVVHVAWSAGEGNGSAIVYRNLTGGRWSPPRALSAPGARAEHPSLTVVASEVFVLWDEADGQIRMARSGGGWRVPVALTQGGRNAHPTTRWAAFGDGGPGATTLDYAWTREGARGPELAFATLGGPHPGPPPAAAGPPSPLPLLLVAAAATAGAFLVVRLRGRGGGGGRPKP